MVTAINSETLESGREDFMRGYVEAMLWANTFVERPGKEDCEPDDVRTFSLKMPLPNCDSTLLLMSH